LRQPAGQPASGPASQSGPLSALLSKENALKIPSTSHVISKIPKEEDLKQFLAQKFLFEC